MHPPVDATTGRVFGLAVESAFPVEGLDAAGGEGLPHTRIVAGDVPDGGVTGPEVSRRDAAFVVHDGEGTALEVSESGDRIVCAPGTRYLTAQALPLASLLRGNEVFHASVVTVGDTAVAISGASGSGKSSIALRLALAGAGLISDDVLAVEPASLTVLPGPAVLKARAGELELLDTAQRARLGSEVAEDGHGRRFRMPAQQPPRPLEGFHLLRRGVGEGIRFRELDRGDPRPLLATTFNIAIRTPERLTRQLDTCARIRAEVPVTWVEIGEGVGAAAVADAIARRAGR